MDGLVALALFGLIVIELLMTPEAGSDPTNALALVLGAAFTLPYAVHRDHAVVALAVCCVGVVTYAFGHFGGYPGYRGEPSRAPRPLEAAGGTCQPARGRA